MILIHVLRQIKNRDGTAKTVTAKHLRRQKQISARNKKSVCARTCCAHVFLCARLCAHVRASAAPTRLWAHVCARKCCPHRFLRTSTSISIRTSTSLCQARHALPTRAYTHIHTRTYTLAHTHVHIHTRSNTRSHTHVHIHTRSNSVC